MKNTTQQEIPTKKVCSKCNRSKPLDAFFNNKWAKDQKCYHCKDCVKAARIALRNEDPEKYRKPRAASCKRWRDKQKTEKQVLLDKIDALQKEIDSLKGINSSNSTIK